MSGRKGRSPLVDLNAPVDTEAPAAVRGQLTTVEEERERETNRQEARTKDAETDRLGSLQQADANRILPRPRTDALNPNKKRALPGESTRRNMLSSRRKKDYSKTKQEWLSSLPNTQRGAVEQTFGNRENLEAVNRALATVNGRRDLLPPKLKEQVRRLDNAIREYGRKNERQHLVYAYMLAPEASAEGRDRFRDQLRGMERGHVVTFDRYVPADHSMGNLRGHDDEVVAEFRTTQGAYLGTSDTTPDGSHVVPGGRFRFAGWQENVEYVKADGSFGARRYVAQFDEVISDERTSARS